MSKTYFIALLLALKLVDAYVYDDQGQRALLVAGHNWGAKVNAFFERSVRPFFP